MDLVRNTQEAEVLQMTSTAMMMPSANVSTTPNPYESTDFELFSPIFSSSKSSYFNGTEYLPTSNISIETPTLEQCDQMFANFTRDHGLNFDPRYLIRIVITWMIFLMSAAGNSFVLASVTIKSPSRSHTHSQIMMAHLTVANLAFTIFLLPTDAIWQSTKQWYGGDFLCRLTNILKQFAMYSSSAMVVVMGFDRVANLMCPVSRLRQRKRILIMLGIAWSFSLINAIPAGVIFNVVNHPIDPGCPDHIVVQCVDLSVAQHVNLRPYYIYTMVVSFFGPLVCILICYVLIAFAISRMARMSKEAQKRSLHQNSGSKRGLDRARRVSLIVTALISATFIICWGPYYVSGLVLWFKGPGGTRLSLAARQFMVMSVYLNPMLHPLITIWLIKEIRDSITSQFKRKSTIPCGSKSPMKKTSQHKYVDSKNNTRGELLPKNGHSNTKEVWL